MGYGNNNGSFDTMPKSQPAAGNPRASAPRNGTPKRASMGQRSAPKAPNTDITEDNSFADMASSPRGFYYKGRVFGVPDVLIGLSADNKITIKVGNDIIQDGLETKEYETKKGGKEMGFGTPLLHPTNWVFGNIGTTAKGTYIRMRLGKERKEPDYDSNAQPGFAQEAVTTASATDDLPF